MPYKTVEDLKEAANAALKHYKDSCTFKLSFFTHATEAKEVQDQIKSIDDRDEILKCLYNLYEDILKNDSKKLAAALAQVLAIELDVNPEWVKQYHELRLKHNSWEESGIKRYFFELLNVDEVPSHCYFHKGCQSDQALSGAILVAQGKRINIIRSNIEACWSITLPDPIIAAYKIKTTPQNDKRESSDLKDHLITCKVRGKCLSLAELNVQVGKGVPGRQAIARNKTSCQESSAALAFLLNRFVSH